MARIRGTTQHFEMCRSRGCPVRTGHALLSNMFTVSKTPAEPLHAFTQRWTPHTGDSGAAPSMGTEVMGTRALGLLGCPPLGVPTPQHNLSCLGKPSPLTLMCRDTTSALDGLHRGTQTRFAEVAPSNPRVMRLHCAVRCFSWVPRVGLGESQCKVSPAITQQCFIAEFNYFIRY